MKRLTEYIYEKIKSLAPNIKVFDVYNDSISEILQMFPNHQHLIINDTARKVLDMHGVSMQ